MAALKATSKTETKADQLIDSKLIDPIWIDRDSKKAARNVFIELNMYLLTSLFILYAIFL